MKIWDSTTARGTAQYPRFHRTKEIQSVVFHPQKTDPRLRQLADATIKLWSTATGKEIQTLRGHKTAISCVAFSPDGRSLVSASSNGNLKIWDLETGRIVQSLTGDTGGVLNDCLQPRRGRLSGQGRQGRYGTHLAHGHRGGTDVVSAGHTTPVESVHFSPDCQRIASISPGDGVAKVWDLTRHPEYATFARTASDVEAIAFADGGQRLLLSVTMAGKLQAWDAATGMLLSMNDGVGDP